MDPALPAENLANLSKDVPFEINAAYIKRWIFPFSSSSLQDCLTLKPGCWPRPPVNYYILIALALMSNHNSGLKVQQIYHFTRSEWSPPKRQWHCGGVPEPPRVSLPERTSRSSRRLPTAGRTASDTTCASTAASAKPATSCAETARGSRVSGT